MQSSTHSPITAAGPGRRLARRPRLRHIAAALAVVTAVGGAAITSQATAQPATMKVHGTIETVLGSSPGCTAPTGLCFPGHVRGSLKGTLDGAVNSLTPTQQADVSLVDATVTIHTRHGDLQFAHEQVVLNTDPNGAGEFAYLMEITGGTGRYATASGYLQGNGNASPSTGVSKATYAGEIKLG